MRAWLAGFALACALAEPLSADVLDVPAALYRMHLANGLEALGLDAASEEGRRRTERLKQGIVDELIDRALVAAEARRRGLAVGADALAVRVRRLVEQMGGEAAWRAQVAAHGLSEAEFRRSVEQELAGQQLREELIRDVVVTSDELAAAYETARKQPGLASLFVEPEQVEAAHVLVRTREQAVTLRNRALEGEDFAALAREFSKDAASRQAGGRLDRFGRGTHPAAFEAAAFGLDAGATSPVVETEYGFHVIRVASHTPERARTLDEVRPAIEARLLARKRAERLAAWLESRRNQARVRWN